MRKHIVATGGSPYVYRSWRVDRRGRGLLGLQYVWTHVNRHHVQHGIRVWVKNHSVNVNFSVQ